MNENEITADQRQRWELVPVEDIIVRERQRKIDPAHVKVVRESLQSLKGQLQLQPIVITEDRVLIDGAHRLEAAKQAGWTHISSLIREGVTEEDRTRYEAEANLIRLQLSPVELEEAWKLVYEPAFKAKAKDRKAEGGLSALQARSDENPAPDDSPVTVSYSNWEPRPSVSVAQLAKSVTGQSLDTLNKVTDIRELAASTTAPKEVQEAAQRGLEKLKRPGASVDTVHKSLLKLQERVLSSKTPPTEREQQRREKRLDQTLTETTLLAERLEGELGQDVLAAARENAVAGETLRGIRVALTHALSSVVAYECSLSADPTQQLQRVGGEVTRMLSEQSISALGLERDV